MSCHCLHVCMFSLSLPNLDNVQYVGIFSITNWFLLLLLVAFSFYFFFIFQLIFLLLFFSFSSVSLLWSIAQYISTLNICISPFIYIRWSYPEAYLFRPRNNLLLSLTLVEFGNPKNFTIHIEARWKRHYCRRITTLTACIVGCADKSVLFF